MKILLHSSKTMKPKVSTLHELTSPQFIDQASYLHKELRDMSKNQLANLMGLSRALTDGVQKQIDSWDDGAKGSPAALTFRGDIYSGLSAESWDKSDAIFAQSHLLILSGLYGLLRPFDEIKPYRLEMGYKPLLSNGLSLDKFWEKALADRLDENDSYVNLSAKEYFKVIEKQLTTSNVISPKFLTISEKTKLPVFVTVHAKIARGSFAGWLIKNKIDDSKKIKSYDRLNYTYDQDLSSESMPVFVCRNFGGLGLSVRLK